MNQVRIQMHQVTREARLPEPVPGSPWLNATQLDRPSFLLSFPFSYSTRAANNPWMQDLPPDRREPDFKRATVQFLVLYRYLAGEALLYPITRENTLVCTELLGKEAVAEIEKVTTVIDVSVDDCYSGICNSVRLPKTVLNSSHVHDLKLGTEDYKREVHKNRQLEDIAANFALEVSYFNLSEFHKSGALLSCMVMHLNRNSYTFTLTA